jgi:hypothetical protein
VFKADPKFLDNEEKYAEIKEEILGGDSDDESGSEEGSDDEEDEDGQCLVYSARFLGSFAHVRGLLP